MLYVVPAIFVETTMTSGRLYELVVSGTLPVERVAVYGAAGSIHLLEWADLRGTLKTAVLAPHVSEPVRLTLYAESDWFYVGRTIYVNPPGVYEVVGKLEESIGRLETSLAVERERIDRLSRAVEELRPELRSLAEELGRLRESVAAEIGKLSATLSEALSSIADLRQYAASLEASLSTERERIDRLGREMDKLGLELLNLVGELGKLSTTLSDALYSIADLR